MPPTTQASLLVYLGIYIALMVWLMVAARKRGISLIVALALVLFGSIIGQLALLAWVLTKKATGENAGGFRPPVG